MQKNNNKNKKIAFFLPFMHQGGGEKVFLDLSEKFSLEGWEVDLLLLEKKGAFLPQVYKDVNIIELPSKKFLPNIFHIGKYLRREKPRAIFTTSPHTSLIAIWAKMFFRAETKTIVRVGTHFSTVFREYKKNENLKDKLLPFLIKRFYKKADVLVANSKGVADDLSNVLGVKREKIKVISNPKFLDKIKEKARESVNHSWFKEKTKPVILSLGRITKQKDFGTLLKAFVKVREKIDARLVILSEGAKNELLETARELGVEEYLDLPGFIENPYSFMARADVFVLSSLWEGMPNALIDAMASGTPVISTDCASGPREILAPNTEVSKQLEEDIEYGEYGILVPIQNEEKMAEAILKMLKDKELSKKYSEKSKEINKKFDIDIIFKKYEEII